MQRWSETDGLSSIQAFTDVEFSNTARYSVRIRLTSIPLERKRIVARSPFSPLVGV